MSKKEFKELEKVFAHESSGRLYQRENKTIKKLEEAGYVEKIKRVLGKDRFGVIEVEGYVTTFKGNYHYCSKVKEQTK